MSKIALSVALSVVVLAYLLAILLTAPFYVITRLKRQNMWLAIKSKLALIVGAIIGVLLLYISALKKTALRKELDQNKAVSKAKDKANDALTEGLENEAKPITRGYFDSNPD